MGKGERSRAETKAHNFSRRQKENRSRTAGEVGEAEGCEKIDAATPVSLARMRRLTFLDM